MNLLIQAILIILFPALAIYLARKFKLFEWIGPVVVCYIAGMLMANVPLDFIGDPPSKVAKPGIDVIEIIQLVSLSLSIPLLVFSLDFKRWLKTAMVTVKSYLLAIVSVIIVTILTFFLIGHTIPEAARVSGMLIGVYTGGTPNMAVIGKILGVDENVFVILNTADVFLGGLYFLFLISFGQRCILLFLKPWQSELTDSERSKSLFDQNKKIEKKDFLRVMTGLGVALIVFVLSIALALAAKLLFDILTPNVALSQPIHLPTLFISLTVLGIACSFYQPLRNLKGSYETGEYLILVFCVALGNMIEVQKLLEFESMSVVVYIAIVMFGAIILHIALAKLFRIDADTMIITSTAAIFGPPFIGPVAEALKNREVVIAGLTSGMVGLAFGTLIGYGLGLFLMALG